MKDSNVDCLECIVGFYGEDDNLYIVNKFNEFEEEYKKFLRNLYNKTDILKPVCK